MLQMVSTRIAASYNGLQALKETGRKVGNLSPVKNEDYNSFIYNQSGFRMERHGNTDLLRLSKIGYVQIRLHRKPVNIKQVIICKQIEKWYAIITCELANPIFYLIDPRRSVGIDLGITKFAHDSTNHVIDNPMFLAAMIKPLRRAQRQQARRQKGGRNYEKARSWVARLHERIRNKRRNFLHDASSYYAKKYDVIFVEHLRTSNMIKNHHIAKSILDSSWSTFRQFLKYKGKMVVEIEPFGTTVDCSYCGNKVPKELAIRIHRCDRCGLVMDRDYNASLNILQKGLPNLPQGLREVTPVKIQCGSMKQEMITLSGKYPHSK